MAPIAELPKPEHGEQKNWRIESESTNGEFVLPDGSEVSVPVSGSDWSVSERYCGCCDAWVTAKGIFGGMWCPTCRTKW